MNNATPFDPTRAMQDLMVDLIKDLKKGLTEGTATAADRNVIRQLLKDHNVQVPLVPGNDLEGLARAAVTANLPFAADGMEHKH